MKEPIKISKLIWNSHLRDEQIGFVRIKKNPRRIEVNYKTGIVSPLYGFANFEEMEEFVEGLEDQGFARFRTRNGDPLYIQKDIVSKISEKELVAGGVRLMKYAVLYATMTERSEKLKLWIVGPMECSDMSPRERMDYELLKETIR